MLEKQIKKEIEQLNKQVDEEQNNLVEKRTRLRHLKNQYAKLVNNDVIGKYYKYKIDEREMQPAHWEYAKILDFYTEDRVYAQIFSTSVIEYNDRPEHHFRFAKNTKIFIQHLEKEGPYVEISKEEYEEQLRLALDRVTSE